MMPAWGYRLALCGSLGLIGLWIAWIIVLAPYPPETRTPVLTVSTLPLLLNLRGLVHDVRRSYVWLGLLSVGYFIHAISAVPEARSQLPAALEAGLALLLFTGCLLRLKKRT